MVYTKSTPKNMQNGKFVNITDFNLANGVLNNINDELENLFNQDESIDFNFNYVSMMDKKYKKRRTNLYGRYMQKIDRKVFTVTPQMKYRHMIEIVDEAYRNFREHKDIHQMKKIKVNKSHQN